MRAAAILIFDKCLYLQGRLQLTTARRLSAYMSSKALATTTASGYDCFNTTWRTNAATISAVYININSGRTSESPDS